MSYKLLKTVIKESRKYPLNQSGNVHNGIPSWINSLPFCIPKLNLEYIPNSKTGYALQTLNSKPWNVSVQSIMRVVFH